MAETAEIPGAAAGVARSAPVVGALYARIVPVVRLMLGMEFLVNGLNWWVKMIDDYPSISDYAHHAPNPTFVGAMIKTGILFHLVKGIELGAGLALLCNRFTPLALVMVAPVTVNVFIVDVVLSTHLRAHIMGGGAMLMSAFLMLAYLSYYRPMLDFRTRFDTPREVGWSVSRPQFDWLDPQASRIGRALMLGLGVASAAIGAVMLVWVFTMIVQHFAR